MSQSRETSGRAGQGTKSFSWNVHRRAGEHWGAGLDRAASAALAAAAAEEQAVLVARNPNRIEVRAHAPGGVLARVAWAWTARRTTTVLPDTPARRREQA